MQSGRQHKGHEGPLQPPSWAGQGPREPTAGALASPELERGQATLLRSWRAPPSE